MLASGAATASQFLSDTSLMADTMKLAGETTILFQGDSITDCGRRREHLGPNAASGFGTGYPLLIASKLLSENPTAKLTCYNRGCSGHRVPDLDGRWQADCLDLKPTVLSILVGVNDIWHKMNGNYDGTVETYETGLKALLEKTRSALPDTKLVICEPFALRCGAVKDTWFPEFDQRREACKRVSDELKCTWVPFQSMFDKATTEETPASYWAGDGVHPSMAGHALMAKTWLQVVFGSNHA